MEEIILKYFENAKEVECLIKGYSYVYDISKVTVKDIVLINEIFYMNAEVEQPRVAVWKDGKYAEIVTTKELKQDNIMKSEPTYTVAQFDKHGDLIREYDKDPSIIIEFKSLDGLWRKNNPVRFYSKDEYRKKPTVIFTNDLKEEFTQEDKDNNLKTFFYDLRADKICRTYLKGVDEVTCYATLNTTQISKTKQGALQLAIVAMNKLNK